MSPNLVYASGKDKTLPYDLQRHITTKFLSKSDRTGYAIMKLYSTRGKHVKQRIAALPADTRVTLFVNGIYKKFNQLIVDHYVTVNLFGNKDRRCDIIKMPSYSHQLLRVTLDTIYYGYHLVRPQANRNSKVIDETPTFTFNDEGGWHWLLSMDVKYCPTEGHTELTKNIQVEDFERLIRIICNMKSPCKKFRDERTKIMLDFSLILEYLATKYTNIKTQENKDKLVAKEQAKTDKLVAKEQAKTDKLIAKEKSKTDKLIAKEKAKTDKLVAKEKATQDKLAATQDKLNQKRELLEMRIQEREMKKMRKNIIM
jgi:hypothetical protein